MCIPISWLQPELSNIFPTLAFLVPELRVVRIHISRITDILAGKKKKKKWKSILPLQISISKSAKKVSVLRRIQHQQITFTFWDRTSIFLLINAVSCGPSLAFCSNSPINSDVNSLVIIMSIPFWNSLRFCIIVSYSASTTLYCSPCQ